VEKKPDQNPISLQINSFRKHTLKLNHQIATKPFCLVLINLSSDL